MLARLLALTQLPPVSLPREYYSTANSSLGLLSSVKTVSYWPAETENSYNSLPGNFKAVSNSQLKLTSTEGKKERKRTY